MRDADILGVSLSCKKKKGEAGQIFSGWTG